MSDDIQKETERINQGIVESLSFSEALAQRDAEIERLRGLLGDVQIILDSHNNIVGNLNGEIERLRKELAEKDDYIRTISRPIGAHSYE